MNDQKEATMGATFVRKVEGNRADQCLWRLSEPYVLNRYEDEPLSVDYVITSAVVAPYSGAETYVFAANEDGKVLDWGELRGSFRGELNHDEAIAGFLEDDE